MVSMMPPKRSWVDMRKEGELVVEALALMRPPMVAQRKTARVSTMKIRLGLKRGGCMVTVRGVRLPRWGSHQLVYLFTRGSLWSPLAIDASPFGANVLPGPRAGAKRAG